MKANRKFLNNDDEAVSPVIAVILMVAITVVLAATVYVWVSGFGSGGGNTPAHTMALTSGGAITGVDSDSDPLTGDADGFEYYYKPYTVASADPSLTWGDLKITFAGVEINFYEPGAAACDTAAALAAAAAPTTHEWSACSGTDEPDADDLVNAGDKLYIIEEQAETTDLSGAELVVLDRQANSVMLTLTVR